MALNKKSVVPMRNAASIKVKKPKMSEDSKWLKGDTKKPKALKNPPVNKKKRVLGKN